MLLYHGTSTEYLHAILRQGLLPRKRTASPSNFHGDFETRSNFVYLTNTYPVFYAQQASTPRNRGVVFCVEVDEQDLYPEDDFLRFYYQYMKQFEGAELSGEALPENYKALWELSLRFLGGVCLKHVRPSRIIDFKVLPADDWRLLLLLGANAAPSVKTHLKVGEWQRRVVNAFFNDGAEAVYALLQNRDD